MYRVNNFDQEKYKLLLEELGKCRRGVKGHQFYEGLMCITPCGYMSSELKFLLDKWCNTNPTASWGSCVQAALKIRDLLFENRSDMQSNKKE